MIRISFNEPLVHPIVASFVQRHEQLTHISEDGLPGWATSIVTASSMPGGRDPVAGDQPVGVVWTWGNGRFGQLGRGMKPNEQQFQEPRPVSILGGPGIEVTGPEYTLL